MANETHGEIVANILSLHFTTRLDRDVWQTRSPRTRRSGASPAATASPTWC